MSWEKIRLGEFLINREDRYKPSDKAIYGLKRIHKIDFSGNIVLSDKASNTDMILVKKGDLVISGINVEKGAMAVYEGEKDIAATIHYSSYSFDEKRIDINFLKYFLKSPEFKEAIKEQVPGGIKTEIKPKHLLPLQVVIPSDIKEQRKIIEKFKNAEKKNCELDSELSNQNHFVIQLRQSFLREAMQGKLVKQDPKDGNARELFEKIKAEKAKSGKKEKELPPIKLEDIPFEIPANWVWCRLGDVVEMNRGRFSIRPRNDPSYFGGPHLFIQIGSLDEHGSVITEAPQTLNEKGYKVSKEFPTGTIAIAIVGGTIGNLGVLGKPMCFTDSIVGVLPSKSYNQEFILTFLRFVQPEIKKAAYQMAGQPNIKIPTLAELLIPFPPFSEQSRIVRRMGELMRLCDELQESIQTSKAQNEMLLQQVLKESLNH